MKLRWGVWLLVVPGLLWTVVRFFGLEQGPLVQLVAFTPYVAVWSLVPLALAVALRRWLAIGAAVVVTLSLFAMVGPRMVGWGDQGDGPVLRVLTANVLAGAGDPAELARLVRENRVDVLLVQEFAPDTLTGLERAGLRELMPYQQLNPVVGTEGSAIYSRLPLTDVGIRRNGGGFRFTQAYGTIKPVGAPPVLVESVHPSAPYSLGMVSDWRADLRNQPRATPDGPVRILAGDFNSTLDHAELRKLLASGYRDAADATGAGLTGTWGPYDGDWIPPVTLDHVLVDRRIGVRDVSVHRLDGSDHRLVFAELSLPRG